MNKTDQERYAISLIGLTLVRGKFELREDVHINFNASIDIDARRIEQDGSETRFGVEVKWVETINQVNIQRYRDQLVHLNRILPVEMAVVVGDGPVVFVSPFLRSMMTFNEKKLIVEEVEEWNISQAIWRHPNGPG